MPRQPKRRPPLVVDPVPGKKKPKAPRLKPKVPGAKKPYMPRIEKDKPGAPKPRIIEDKFYRTMPITEGDLRKIKKAYGIK